MLNCGSDLAFLPLLAEGALFPGGRFRAARVPEKGAGPASSAGSPANSSWLAPLASDEGTSPLSRELVPASATLLDVPLAACAPVPWKATTAAANIEKTARVLITSRMVRLGIRMDRRTSSSCRHATRFTAESPL